MNQGKPKQAVRLKMEEMEDKLGSDSMYKDSVLQDIRKAKDSILPMRLRFNDLINTIASIDKTQGKSSQEKFTMIRAKVLELSTEIQSFCGEYHKLQPVFEAMQQYSKEGKTSKKFTPLETLRHVNEVTINTQSKPPNATSPSNARLNKSNVNTPASNVPTPSAGGNVAVKKPRKPRQKKNSIPGAASIPLQASPPTNPPQILSNMSPMNMMSSPMSTMSPVNGSMNLPYNGSASISTAPKPQSQPQRHIPSASQQLNMNNITPANILNMSMMEQNPMQAPSSQQSQLSQPQHQSSNSLDLNSLDLNNIDLASLNMDFLQ